VTRSLLAVTAADLPAAFRAALEGTGPAIFVGAPTRGDASGELPPHVNDDVAVVVQSSGSTSTPKRVALSASAILASSRAAQTVLGGPGQWLLALPTSYIAGLNVLARSIMAGTVPVNIVAGSFTAERFCEATQRMATGPRFTSLVPAQLARILDDESATAAARAFDRILVGGQASPASLIARAGDAGLHVTRTYGSSETSGGCVWDGTPLPSVELDVVDGEIYVAGPVVANGYLQDPDRTAAHFVTEHGRRWYRTGDSGLIVDGILQVTGRRDDVIISGGEKISLGELERFIVESTPLIDAVVVAADHATWGHVPVVASTKSMELAQLRSVVAARFGRAAAPDRLLVLPELPTLESGKPDRLAIRSAAHR
jgi:o-succinylbenzoate---CoA ligase